MGKSVKTLVLGGFLLILIARPLAAAAVGIQNELASTPAFSELTAGVLALLIIAAIVEAIFNNGR